MKFFSMWYKIQDKDTKGAVKQLIKEGRFEITMGGWVGADEATTNYEDIIGSATSTLGISGSRMNSEWLPKLDGTLTPSVTLKQTLPCSMTSVLRLFSSLELEEMKLNKDLTDPKN